MRGKNKIVGMTSLQQVLTLTLSRWKRKKSSISSALTIKERGITPISVLRTQKKNQKNSVGLGDLYANDCN